MGGGDDAKKNVSPITQCSMVEVKKIILTVPAHSRFNWTIPYLYYAICQTALKFLKLPSQYLKHNKPATINQ